MIRQSLSPNYLVKLPSKISKLYSHASSIHQKYYARLNCALSAHPEATTFNVYFSSFSGVYFNIREITNFHMKLGWKPICYHFDKQFIFTSSTDTKQKTIYEYHRVEIDTTKIVNNSAFEFTPLPSE